MKRVAVYGKGGIGKSTISSNLTAALSDNGVRVLQIGCDPKHDSTRLLTDGLRQETVLEYLKEVPETHRKLDDVVEEGYKGCLCVEAGGPEPGIGCAGRGIISAFELLDQLGIDTIPLDLILYDVLGDVVCGGFAVPLRNSYADTVYIVTSGEFMSIYAANNILRGTANYNPDRIGGLIFNSRGDPEEKLRVERFSKAVKIPIVAEFSRSREFLEAEQVRKTVVEAYPESSITESFRNLAKTVMRDEKHTANFLSEGELENVVLGRSMAVEKTTKKQDTIVAKEKKRYSSRNVHRKEILHGCAFSGASSVTSSITDLVTILHSPKSCAQFAFQMVSNSVRRSYATSTTPLSAFADPCVQCTDMSESTMIFGGTDVLEKNIRSTIADGNKHIAVISSCPSGIIGDDVGQVIDRLKGEFPDTLLIDLREDGNLKGDFMQGVIDASLGLIRSTAIKNLKKTDSVNLIGYKTLATNSTVNVENVREILSRMDISINCTAVGNTDVEDLKNLTAAKLNIQLYPDRFAFMLRDFLVDEYGMECAKNIIRPGLNETRKWITEIGKHFGREDKAKKIIEDIEIEYRSLINSLKPKLKGRSIYLAATHKDINWIMEVIHECEMDLRNAVILDFTDHCKDYDLDVDYPVTMCSRNDVSKLKDDIISNDPDLLISTYPMNLGIRAEECFIPVAPDVGPYSGPELAISWVRKLQAPKEEGWRKDVVRK